MCSNIENRNKVYSTKLLETPLGVYYGNDVLEGFAADAEYLGRATTDNENFDKAFYDLCKLDNLYVYPIEIPHMTVTNLDNIIAQTKFGKACDIYQMTAEHLKLCGPTARLSILKLINRIIDDIYFLTCPQVKIGLGASLHKGKKKPKTKSKSYRRITVTPVIGSILDKYVDPPAEKIFRSVQSPDQLEFTANVGQ